MSEKNARRMTKIIARGAYIILARDRKWAYRNLDLVFGDNLTPEEKRRIVLGSFETIVQTRIDCIRWTENGCVPTW